MEHTREARLEHNLRGMIDAHKAAKARLGEPVDEDFLDRLLEKDDGAVTDGLDIDLGNRRIRARGPIPVIAAVVLLLLLVASAAPAFVLYRAVAQVEAGVRHGFVRMEGQHDKLIDLQEAMAWTFLPPDVRARVVLPKWVRDHIDREVPGGQSVRRETLETKPR